MICAQKGIEGMGYARILKDSNGNRQVIYTPYGDAKIAHPAFFEVLDDGMPHDRQFSFSYGRDEEFVYYFTGSTDTKHAVRLKVCRNPKAFSDLSEQFVKDDKHVYFANRMIEADVKTFIVPEDGYAKDNTHLFCRGNIVKEQL